MFPIPYILDLQSSGSIPPPPSNPVIPPPSYVPYPVPPPVAPTGILYTDLTELKAKLEIDPNNPNEDLKLSFLIKWASDWIGEILNRPGMFYAQRTEYYSGTGRRTLNVNSRPIYPFVNTPYQIQVYEDDIGSWGTAADAFTAPGSLLNYGVDYALKIDPNVNGSRSGILYRLNQLWPKPFGRFQGYLSPYQVDGQGNIKVVYYGGYTVDTLPEGLRLGVELIIARMRFILPVGLELSADAYEEKSLAILAEKKDYLLSLALPMILPYRNWRW